MAGISDKKKAALIQKSTSAVTAQMKAYVVTEHYLSDAKRAWNSWGDDKTPEVVAFIAQNRDRELSDATAKRNAAYTQVINSIKTVFKKSGFPVADEHNKVIGFDHKYPQNAIFHEVLNTLFSPTHMEAVSVEVVKERDQAALKEYKRLNPKADAISGGIKSHGNDVISNPVTVVLAGFDHNNAFKSEIDACHAQKVHVIKAEPGVSFDQAVAKIVTPANVVLAAHGQLDGTFEWEPGSSHSYKEFFNALPRGGIASVVVESCFGGSAEQAEFLRYAPEGALLISEVGPTSVSLSSISIVPALLSQRNNPVDLYIDALSTINVDSYQGSVDSDNKAHKTNYDNSPSHVLPKMIGVGGNPPSTIDLDVEIRKLQDDSVDKKAWSLAVDRLKSHHFTATAKQIDGVADKLRQGYALDNPGETRIAYALTAAYLDESGDLEKEIGAAQHLIPPLIPPVQKKVAHPFSGIVPDFIAQAFAKHAQDPIAAITGNKTPPPFRTSLFPLTDANGKQIKL